MFFKEKGVINKKFYLFLLKSCNRIEIESYYLGIVYGFSLEIDMSLKIVFLRWD